MAQKFYKQVFVTDGLPKKEGEYFTDQGELNFSFGMFWAFQPIWWLKEFDLSEVMLKYAEAIRYNCSRECGTSHNDLPTILNDVLREEGFIIK